MSTSQKPNGATALVILVFFAMPALLFGCTPTPTLPGRGGALYARSLAYEWDGEKVWRIDDFERNQTCYVYSGYKRGGISCGPLTLP